MRLWLAVYEQKMAPREDWMDFSSRRHGVAHAPAHRPVPPLSDAARAALRNLFPYGMSLFRAVVSRIVFLFLIGSCCVNEQKL